MRRMLDVIRGCSITYCYSSRCSADTGKINLMVFAHVVYCVVELKYVTINVPLSSTHNIKNRSPLGEAEWNDVKFVWSKLKQIEFWSSGRVNENSAKYNHLYYTLEKGCKGLHTNSE